MSGNKKLSKNPRAKKVQKPVCERDRTVRKEHVDFHITEESVNSTAMPIDLTFKRLTATEESGPEFTSRARLGKIEMGPRNKLLSRSLWLNNNSICDIRNIEVLVESVMEYPERMGFLDLSHNAFKLIDDGILKFVNLKVLYLHDNKISELEEVFKLRKLMKLCGLTLYGNPLYDNRRLGNIRTVVTYLLPGIKKLDHNKLAGIEMELPVSAQVLRFLEEKEGRVPSYIPSKPAKKRREAIVLPALSGSGDHHKGPPPVGRTCTCNPKDD